MTDQQHPISPPPELVQQWNNEAVEEWTEEHPARLDLFIAARAAQWGADQELEACCALLQQKGVPAWSLLRMHRRPKPPSLKEQALETLKYPKDLWSENEVDTIRRALESIND